MAGTRMDPIATTSAMDDPERALNSAQPSTAAAAKPPRAFAGGVLMAFGARLAGGCTSGHGISGTLQLNVASWIAVICFFVGGAFVAALLFRS